MTKSINNAANWRDRAEEMRVLSGLMHGHETTAIMLRLADDYDEMAARAENRAAEEKTS